MLTSKNEILKNLVLFLLEQRLPVWAVGKVVTLTEGKIALSQGKIPRKLTLNDGQFDYVYQNMLSDGVKKMVDLIDSEKACNEDFSFYYLKLSDEQRFVFDHMLKDHGIVHAQERWTPTMTEDLPPTLLQIYLEAQNKDFHEISERFLRMGSQVSLEWIEEMRQGGMRTVIATEFLNRSLVDIFLYENTWAFDVDNRELRKAMGKCDYVSDQVIEVAIAAYKETEELNRLMKGSGATFAMPRSGKSWHNGESDEEQHGEAMGTSDKTEPGVPSEASGRKPSTPGGPRAGGSEAQGRSGGSKKEGGGAGGPRGRKRMEKEADEDDYTSSSLRNDMDPKALEDAYDECAYLGWDPQVTREALSNWSSADISKSIAFYIALSGGYNDKKLSKRNESVKTFLTEKNILGQLGKASRTSLTLSRIAGAYPVMLANARWRLRAKLDSLLPGKPVAWQDLTFSPHLKALNATWLNDLRVAHVAKFFPKLKAEDKAAEVEKIKNISDGIPDPHAEEVKAIVRILGPII